MKTTAMFEIKVSGGQITCEQEVPDGKYKLVLDTEDATCHKQKGLFKKVPASELSLDDEFMQYPPKTDRERIFKDRVEQAIKSGLKDFWRPV